MQSASFPSFDGLKRSVFEVTPVKESNISVKYFYKISRDSFRSCLYISELNFRHLT